MLKWLQVHWKGHKLKHLANSIQRLQLLKKIFATQNWKWKYFGMITFSFFVNLEVLTYFLIYILKRLSKLTTLSLADTSQVSITALWPLHPKYRTILTSCCGVWNMNWLWETEWMSKWPGSLPLPHAAPVAQHLPLHL